MENKLLFVVQALRESEAKARAAERELAELRVEHSALQRKCQKIMSILKSDDSDAGEISEEAETEESEDKFQEVEGIPLIARVGTAKSDENDGTSPDLTILISGDESDVSLTGSFARISLKSPPTPATSEDDDSEDDDTSPVFLREMAKQHKVCSDNFIERAKSAEKRGDAVAAEKVKIYFLPI